MNRIILSALITLLLIIGYNQYIESKPKVRTFELCYYDGRIVRVQSSIGKMNSSCFEVSENSFLCDVKSYRIVK